MSTNPFKPPSADVDVPDTRRGSPIKALVLGVVVDFAGTMVASTVFFLLFGAYLAASGTPADAAANYGLGLDSPMGIVLNIVGSLFSVLGGYVCARVAKHSEYGLGGILAVVNVVLGLLLGGEAAANAYGLISSVITFAAVMVGTHIGAQQNRRAVRAAINLGVQP